MRVVALEEHFALPEFIARVPAEAIVARGWPAMVRKGSKDHAPLADLGAGRLANMDESGITVQVLSASAPGADLMYGEDAIQFARDINDRLARTMTEHSGRFGGFAHLPTTNPEAAADELERCVSQLRFSGGLINGMTEGRFLDDPCYAPLLSRAEALDVPLYLHPGLPPPAVRDAYYQGLPEDIGFTLSIAGWGWHAETGLHILRLALSGTFDRHPKLKMIIGHMGEGLPVMLDRIDEFFGHATSGYLSRSVSQTLRDHLWITTSGMFNMPSFLAAMLAFGTDRILFSVDYPYSPNSFGRRFLDIVPVSPSDKAKICHANADALLRLDKS